MRKLRRIVVLSEVTPSETSFTDTRRLDPLPQNCVSMEPSGGTDLPRVLCRRRVGRWRRSMHLCEDQQEWGQPMQRLFHSAREQGTHVLCKSLSGFRSSFREFAANRWHLQLGGCGTDSFALYNSDGSYNHVSLTSLRPSSQASTASSGMHPFC